MFIFKSSNDRKTLIVQSTDRTCQAAVMQLPSGLVDWKIESIRESGEVHIHLIGKTTDTYRFYVDGLYHTKFIEHLEEFMQNYYSNICRVDLEKIRGQYNILHIGYYDAEHNWYYAEQNIYLDDRSTGIISFDVLDDVLEIRNITQQRQIFMGRMTKACIVQMISKFLVILYREFPLLETNFEQASIVGGMQKYLHLYNQIVFLDIDPMKVNPNNVRLALMPNNKCCIPAMQIPMFAFRNARINVLEKNIQHSVMAYQRAIRT